MANIRIELAVNNKCNFCCSYCCGYLNKKMSNLFINPINIERLLLYLNNYRYNDIKEIKICGGEPLLYPHLTTLYITLSKYNNIRISMDTNNSIRLDDNLLNAMKMCNNNHVNVELVLSYHKEILDKHPKFLTNYYYNIQKLLDNNISIKIRLLYSDSTYTQLEYIANDLLKRFNNKIKIEWRLIFSNNKSKSMKISKRNKCSPFRYFGIFPNNMLYYSCFREIYGEKCKQYAINKMNLTNFMLNIDKKIYMTDCDLYDKLLFCADI